MRIHHRTCAVPIHLTNPDVRGALSRSLHKCSLGAVKLEKVQCTGRTDQQRAWAADAFGHRLGGGQSVDLVGATDLVVMWLSACGYRLIRGGSSLSGPWKGIGDGRPGDGVLGCRAS
jgi:CubicO group peptidase (beta-lactamase class C family)